MSNWRRTRSGGDNLGRPSTVAYKTKEEFAQDLYRRMISKGWNQSELAERAGLTRNAISVYMRAQALPSPDSLAKLAAAFDMEPADLMPNHVTAAIDVDVAVLEMKISTSDPTKAWLRINRLVRVDTAANIIKMLNDDDVAEGK